VTTPPQQRASEANGTELKPRRVGWLQAAAADDDDNNDEARAGGAAQTSPATTHVDARYSADVHQLAGKLDQLRAKKDELVRAEQYARAQQVKVKIGDVQRQLDAMRKREDKTVREVPAVRAVRAR
jgi:hypothetical protein